MQNFVLSKLNQMHLKNYSLAKKSCSLLAPPTNKINTKKRIEFYLDAEFNPC